jgi:CHAT domain-containing protein
VGETEGPPAAGARYRFAGVASPVIDGVPGPDVDVVVEWGGGLLFLLTSPGPDRGGLTWIVADDEDAEVTAGDTGVTVRLGPLDAPVAPPMWWGTAIGPLGGVAFPHEARAGAVDLSLDGETLVGTVRLTGAGPDGGETRYEATIRCRPALVPATGDAFGEDIFEEGTRNTAGAALGNAVGDAFGNAVGGTSANAVDGSPPASASPIDRLMDIDRRIAAATDLSRLLDHMKEAVELRRELSVGITATAAFSRWLADVRAGLVFDRDMLAAVTAHAYLPDGAADDAGPAPAQDDAGHDAGHDAGLGELLRAAEEEMAGAALRLGRIEGAPLDPARLAEEVDAAADILIAAETRLRRIAGRVLAADRHILPPAHPLRLDRERLLALLDSASGDPEIGRLEAAWDDAIAHVADDPTLSMSVKTVAVALTGSASRLRHLRDHLGRLDPVGHACRTREGNAVAISRLGRRMELWRARIATDWERILMMDRTRPVHGHLVGTLLDLGGPLEALVASESVRARAFADLVSGRRPAPVPTPARLSAVLRAHGAPLVEYFLDGDRLIIFLAGPDGTVEAVEVRVDPDALLGWVDELHHRLRTAEVDRTRLRELLRLLGGVLWDPIAHRLPAGRGAADPLTVVPHDHLLRVPFHALIDALGRYVVEHHATTVLPAASILAALMARRADAPPPSRGICALVDPEPMPAGLPPLPLLRAHFGVVGGMFPEADLHVGAAATRSALIEGAARRPAVLCLATHAEVVPGDPMASFVALAGDRLTARAVQAMELPARLVVLAACETGAGRVTGDGVIGLSRAFLAAGPLAVLMTLWPITERDSLRLLRRFHDLQVNSGYGTAAALRAAQCSLLADGGGDDPERWAAFTLFGLPD